jgi:NADH-quinone oxidoreductase subunit C
VPDATELELTAQELREAHSDSIIDTEFHRGRATLVANPKSVKAILEHLRDNKGYTFLASVHGVDYYPQEPRLGVLYELMDRQRVERISVKARVHTEHPHVESVVELFPGANYQERETYDMFGVVFDGHPDLRRILMPEDYEGFPQRRDFPIGGEPILFTYNEEQNYGKYV